MDQSEYGHIHGFPNYAVSRAGHVLNMTTNRMMRISYTQFGHAKVSLVTETGRHTLSVAKLVATAFVEPPNPLCIDIIVLNGNFADLRAENLMWRPPAFAWLYTRQLKDEPPIHYHNLPVFDTVNGLRYENVITAGMSLGVLFDDIWRSTYQGSQVYPTNSAFIVSI